MTTGSDERSAARASSAAHPGPPAAIAPRVCDLSTTCFVCGAEMQPEHAHYRCRTCGWRDSCCDGPY